MESDLDKLRALISGWRRTVKPVTQARVTGWAGSQWFQYATDLGKANLPGRISAGESPSCLPCERLTFHELIATAPFPSIRRVQKFAYSWQALAERPPSNSGNDSGPVICCFQKVRLPPVIRAVLLGSVTLLMTPRAQAPNAFIWSNRCRAVAKFIGLYQLSSFQKKVSRQKLC